MRRLNLLLVAVMLCSAAPALAGFTNGGFETGDFTGWTLVYGYRSPSDLSITWDATSWCTGHLVPAGIWDSTSFTSSSSTPVGPTFGLTTDINPYNGNYMARIGDRAGGNHATEIWQQGALSAQDITNGTLYVNWGAALIEPGHPLLQEPYFGITVSRNGTVLYNFTVDASAHATDPTWQLAGSDGFGYASPGGPGSAPLYYKSATWSADISGWAVSDVLKVDMFVSDCGQSGHGSYAFLDDIGTTYVAPGTIPPGNNPAPGPVTVPAPGAILLASLGLSLAAGWLRRRKELV